MPGSPRSLRIVLRPALLAAGLIAAGLALRDIPGELALGPGAHSPGQALAFCLVGAAACAAGLPRQGVAFAGAYAFGIWTGGALALAAQALGCLADFLWARFLARDLVARRLRGRLARLDRLLAAEPFRATLALRLMPVGNNLALNLIAGASAIRPAPFLAASMLGYIPQTAVFALLGGGVRVSGPAQLGLGAALLAASVGLGLAVWRRSRPLSEAA